MEEGSQDMGFEPQINSDNPAERRIARQIRIQRRVDAINKAKASRTDADTQVLDPKEKNPIDNQVEKSAEILDLLLLEGEEYISNVRIANEAREAERREREGFGKETLLKHLEEEALVAEENFNDIANKWAGILKYHDPLHIQEDLNLQKEKCDEVIKQKDAIIANLRVELKNAEINFAVDQTKQIEDINSITRRIENQITIMMKEFRRELVMVEEVIMTERQNLIESTNKKWEELYKRRDQDEITNAERKTQEYWSFVQEMDNLNLDFEELIRATNISLEVDCDLLYRELERVKTEVLMNGEKLDYNYQILKKREDENLIIRSQQKRRINKMQDAINLLRVKIRDYSKETSIEIQKLSKDIKKLSGNVLDIENKADHMAKVNNETFRKVWDLNERRAKDLCGKILQIDQVLYEQQLGLEWDPPGQKLLQKKDLVSYVRGLEILKANKTQAEKNDTKTNEAKYEENANYRNIVKKILHLIAERTGFLVEDQLRTILNPYLEDDRNLIKIDNVFSALNVSDKRDVGLLLDHFLPYMFCPLCNIEPEGVTVSEEKSSAASSAKDEVLEMPASVNFSFSDLEDPFQFEKVEHYLEIFKANGLDARGTVVQYGQMVTTLFDISEGECRGNQGDEKIELSTHSNESETIPCQYQHPLVISSVYVLKALNDFLAKYHVITDRMPTINERLAYKRITLPRLLASADLKLFWESFTRVFPPDRETLWDSLLEGLKKYHEILKVRKTRSEEVNALRRQNEELRRLFAHYIGENVLPY